MKVKWNGKKFKKILKRTGLALCTIALTGTIAIGSYDAYLNSKLDEVEISKEDVETIQDHYSSTGHDITIFVMNDSQGLNLNLAFWKNSYPEYLEEELSATVIDASSLRYNKVCHIDMLLDNNLSIEEMKKLNSEGSRYALKKYANENGYKLFSGFFSSIGGKALGQKIEDGDEDTHISDLIRDSYEPIIIYSSGANDLMFLANANPNSIKKYGEDGSITNKYLYAESVLSNSATIDMIMESIEKNFIKILSINPNSKVFVLSIYVPSSLSNEDYEVFVIAINEYNNKLQQLCDKYGMCYVDESSFGEIYNDKDYDFHIDVVGHKQLASMIISEIANHLYMSYSVDSNDYTYDNDGLEGYYYDLVYMANSMVEPSNEDIEENEYLKKVYSSQLKSREEDAEICKKLIKKYR